MKHREVINREVINREVVNREVVNTGGAINAWTTMSVDELTELLTTGRLTTNPGCTLAEVYQRVDGNVQFKLAYTWMAAKLAAHTGCRPTEYPRWVWTRVLGQPSWHGSPVAFHHHQPGTYALVELNLARADVLLSDYEAWHAPLNGWYLATSEEGDAAHDDWLAARGIPSTDVLAVNHDYGPVSNDRLEARRRTITSWDHCLVDGEGEPPSYLSSWDTTQGVVWELNRSRIVRAGVFKVTADDVEAYDEGRPSATLGERLRVITVD